MLVGKAHGIADEELFTSNAWSRLWFVLRGGVTSLGDDGRVRNNPAPPSCMILDHRLCGTQFDHTSLAQRAERVISEVADVHAKMQVLADLQHALRIVKHPADGQIESIQFGAVSLPKVVQGYLHDGNEN